MKISIKWVLVIGILCCIWGTVAITVSSAFITSQRVLIGHARDIMDNIAEFAMAQSRHHLALAQGAAHLTKRLITSNVVSDSSQQIESLERYFYDQLVIYPHFAGIYFGSPAGDFYYVSRNNERTPGGFRTKIIRYVDGKRQVRLIWRDADNRLVAAQSDPEDRYDPRQRPWYIKARNLGKIVWTDPYVFYTSQKPGITIAGPVFGADQTLRGVVGVDIEIDQLSTFIGKLRIGKNGRAFMLNRNKDMVAFPDVSKITRENSAFPGQTRLVKVDEIDDPLSRQAFQAVDWTLSPDGRLQIDRPLFANFQYNHETYHVMFTPFSQENWPWIIGVYVPESDYLGEIKANRTMNILMAIAISVAVSLIALLVAHSIIRPISELENAAHAVKMKDLTDQEAIQSVYKEIQETADSFSTMKTALRRHEAEAARLEKQIRHSQKMEAIGTLAGGVAHDFNNILYPIIGYTEMALDKLSPESEAAPHLEEVLIASHRAQKLVSRILTFSRNDHEIRIPMKIQDVIEEVLDLLRSTLPATIDIHREIDAGCGPIFADPTQIQQVVMNLCTNAFHAMQENGGQLSVKLVESRIVADDAAGDEAAHPASYAKLTISDTGCGISESILDRIFDPYFTTKEAGEGTGMGLAMVMGIVRGYGGDIQVHSRVDEGTTVDVYLPQTSQPPAALPREQDAPVIQTGSERIMVIDDEDQIVRMLDQMLSQLGYQVSVFQDGRQALAQFEASPHHWDLVITDMTMPHITGDIITREMLKIRPDIPIILCTGFSELIDRKQAITLGVQELVLKPVVKGKLAATIRRVLEKCGKPV